MTLVTAGALPALARRLLLVLPALPRAYDRHAELTTPELAGLREASHTDGRDISPTESAGISYQTDGRLRGNR